MGRGLRKLVTILDNVGIAVSATAIFVMGLAVATNTILRYSFNRPWFFVEEYSAYVVVMVTFLALGYTLKEKGHIAIDIIVNRFPERARTGLAVVTVAVSLVITGVMFWYGLALALSSLQHDTRASTVMLTPLWIPQVFVALGLFIFGLELMAYLATKVNEFRTT